MGIRNMLWNDWIEVSFFFLFVIVELFYMLII